MEPCEGLGQLVNALESCLSISNIQKAIEYYDEDINQYLLLEDANLAFNATKPTKIRVFTSPTCQIHNEKLSFLCSNHLVIGCSHCFVIGEHKGCQGVPIKESRDLCKEKFDTWKVCQIAETLKKNIENITTSERRVSLLQAAYERRIEEEYNKIIEILKQKKIETKKQVAKEIQDNLDCLSNYRSNQEKKMASVRNCISILARDDSSEFEIANTISALSTMDFGPTTRIQQLTSFTMGGMTIPDMKITKLFNDVPVEPILIEKNYSKKNIQKHLFTSNVELFAPAVQHKQFYALKIAGSRFQKENPQYPLEKLQWRVRKAPHRNTDNQLYLLRDEAIVEVLSVNNNWLELKNGFTLLADIDRGSDVMWHKITSWTKQFSEMNSIIPGCYQRVTSTLALTAKSICNSRLIFMAQIAALLINQFNCTIFGGFIRDYIFRNEEPSNLDVAIPGTFESFFTFFAFHLELHKIQMKNPPVIEGDVATVVLTNGRFTSEVTFVVTDNVLGAPTVDFDVNNFQLTTFGATKQPILYQRATLFKSNQEILKNIRGKKCEIADNEKLQQESYKTHLIQQRIPNMQNKGWTIVNRNRLL